ncbi:hypothetical protein Daus18300_006170 [Diaporthe australafricana]|uniref:Subtilisin-like serine protease n=1 Tax=Diaporthe australafricana TaxID=127596 RepID=A0ABR3WW42_9PEZI
MAKCNATAVSPPQVIPFEHNEEQCTSLRLSESGRSLVRGSHEDWTGSMKDYLPGNPRIALSSDNLERPLGAEFTTSRLDRLGPHLWLLAKPDSRHISSLTHQIVRGRQIIVTEDPDMHLLWYEDRVYIKPLPKYLLSHAFWVHLNQLGSRRIHAEGRQEYELAVEVESARGQSEVLSSALGFLRSYAFLLRHKSDFQLARESHPSLLPRGIRYATLVRLLQSVEDRITDDQVSPRWSYGELRLSRLNFWSKIFLHEIEYCKVTGQYSTYVAKFYAPLLFIFGVFSVILSALQVGQEVDDETYARYLTPVTKGFFIFTLNLVLFSLFCVITAFGTRLLRELIYALRKRIRRSHE